MINKEAIFEAIQVYGEHASKFVQLTIKDAENFYLAIHEAAKSQDQEALVVAAHSLKSIMRQTGAYELADEALVWEQKGKSKISNFNSQELKKLDDLYDETKKLLEGIMSQNRNSHG